MFYTLYLYQKGFDQFAHGLRVGHGLVAAVIIAAFTAFNFLAAKYWVFYDD